MNFTVENLVEYLQPLSKENIVNINKKLIFNSGKIIGVCIPDLHKLAKQFVANGSYVEILEMPHNLYYEIDILQGLIIGYIKKPIDFKIKYLSSFTSSIQNWSVCDTTACNLKPKKVELNKLYDFANNIAFSKYDFAVRFAVVVLMRYYFDKYLEILTLLNNLEYGKNYYIDMAVAWLIAEFTAKSIKAGFDEIKTNPILHFLKSDNNLNAFTVKKAYQKMRESYQIPTSWKIHLR